MASIEWTKIARESKNAEGRRLLCENSHELHKFHEFLPYFLQDESLIGPEDFISCISSVRNVCTSSNGFVESISGSNFMLRLGRISQCLVFADKQESFPFKPEESPISLLLVVSDEKRRGQFVRLVAQLAANFAAISEESADHIMTNFILPKTGLRDLLAACKILKEDAALSASWTVVLNATQTSYNLDRLINKSQRDLLCQLFLSAHDNTAGAEGVSLFCRRLLTQSSSTTHLNSLFCILGPLPIEETENEQRGTLEQVALLFGLDTALEQGQMFLANYQSQQKLAELLITVITSPQIKWALSSSAVNSADRIRRSSEAHSNEEMNDNQIRTDIARAWTVAVLSLLGSGALVILTSSKLPCNGVDNGNEMRRLMMRRVMPLVFEQVLSGQDPVSRRTLSLAASNGKQHNLPEDETQQWIGEAVRQGLRLFTILLQEHAEAAHPLNMQTLDPSEEDILLPHLTSLLQHCATDFTNPLCREWALLGIQAFTSRSIKAREILTQLQPKGIIEDEGLREAGLRARLDHATGRVVVEKTSGEEN